MFALILVAGSLGLSNFGASIGLGVSGLTARRRLEVGLVFGLFEAGMPALGLALGRGLARDVGAATGWIGGGIRMATGAYALTQAIRANARSRHRHRSGRPLMTE
jgi:manganese efflux pump family protein